MGNREVIPMNSVTIVQLGFFVLFQTALLANTLATFIVIIKKCEYLIFQPPS
jgi:hypothetical protein